MPTTASKWQYTSRGDPIHFGSYAFFVRAGLKPIEFDKGKTAIAVSSLDKMSAVIDTVIAAVRKGELDEQLAHASKQASTKKSKKAA